MSFCTIRSPLSLSKDTDEPVPIIRFQQVSHEYLTYNVPLLPLMSGLG